MSKITSLFLCILATILLSGCSSSQAENKTGFNRAEYLKKHNQPEYFVFNGRKIPNRVERHFTPLTNNRDIKLFIYDCEIEGEIDLGIDYKKLEYRLMRESDFDYIAEKLRQKYPGLKIKSGYKTFSPNGDNAVDKLDYSRSYMIKHHVVLYELCNFSTSDNNQNLSINMKHTACGDRVTSPRNFIKKKQQWFYKGSLGETIHSVLTVSP